MRAAGRALRGTGGGRGRGTGLLKAAVAANAGVYMAWTAAEADPALRARMENALLLSPSSATERPWTLLSHAFSHHSAGHLAVNMIALYTAGRGLSLTVGAGPVAAAFLASAAAGGLAYVLERRARDDGDRGGREVEVEVRDTALDQVVQLPGGERLVLPSPETRRVRVWRPYEEQRSEGASGGVYGVVGLFAVLFPRERFALVFFPFVAFPVRVLLGCAMVFDATALARCGTRAWATRRTWRAARPASRQA